MPDHRSSGDAELLERIVSGGQTGVDRAALDVALQTGFPCGGWVPLGRMAEDGPLAAEYPVQETDSPSYALRTRWNIRDSDGTLILTDSTMSRGTALTRKVATEQKCPLLIVDFRTNPAPADVADWIRANRIRTLNVAGPRASSSPNIYDRTLAFLRDLLPTIATRGDAE